MNYSIVFPRDLFNHSKLLKCLGQLTLLIEDKVLQNIEYEYDSNKQIDIYMDGENNLFFALGIVFRKTLPHFRVRLHFGSVINSKKPYPLELIVRHNTGLVDVIEVFNDDGTPTTEFKNYLEK